MTTLKLLALSSFVCSSVFIHTTQEREPFNRVQILGDEHGRWTDAGFEMVSPNIAENLTSDQASERLSFEQARQRLNSERQERLVTSFEDIDKKLHLDSEHIDAIGEWADGAENSVFVKVYAGTLEDIRYSAAQKGDLADQKAVIAFKTDKQGPDSMYEFDLKADAQHARSILSNAGIQYRTLVPGTGITHIAILDPGSSLGRNLEKLEELQHHDVEIRVYHGHGEFIGGDTREQGHAAYHAIIDSYEKEHG